MSARPSRRPRVLVLSRNYPNPVLPRLGLWVQSLVRQIASRCDVTVVAPIPYWPPVPGPREYARFRKVERERREGDVAVRHPRFLAGPGYALHGLDAASQFLAVRRTCDRIHEGRGFDLVHAHFGYPDGVVAALLSRRYGVPAVVTEHAYHHPWLDEYPLARRQVIWSRRRVAALIAVSERVRDDLVAVPEHGFVRVIPVGVDGEMFHPGGARTPSQVLFVGHITYAKGVDVLLEAAARLLAGRPNLRFVFVGEGPYRHKRLQEDELRRRAKDLGLAGRVLFAGGQSPEETARWMRESAVLVLPSRRETFGAVLIEALASGTPVVATRCGGPEDIVTGATGLLVLPGDVPAMADAIGRILDSASSYDPEVLRRYALERFSWETVASRTVAVYREVLDAALAAERRVPEAEKFPKRRMESP